VKLLPVSSFWHNSNSNNSNWGCKFERKKHLSLGHEKPFFCRHLQAKLHVTKALSHTHTQPARRLAMKSFVVAVVVTTHAN